MLNGKNPVWSISLDHNLKTSLVILLYFLVASFYYQPIARLNNSGVFRNRSTYEMIKLEVTTIADGANLH